MKPPAHTHAPVAVLHTVLAGHASQVTPAAPHNELVSLASGSQLDPLQQPAHEDPPQVHEPLEHESPAAHEVHVAPSVPH